MSEWKETQLKEFIKVSSGEGLPDSKMKPGQYPVYGGNGITGFHNEYLFSERRLIIGRVGALCGNVHITQNKSWITDNALVVSFVNINQTVKFWYYLLSYLNLREFAFQSAQPVITGGIIEKIKIKIPVSISEQKYIAQILSTCDTVIEKTQSAIAKYKAIKQGLLHDLFTRGLDTNGHLRPSYQQAPELYKESELGMIPKEWEEKQLLNIVDNTYPVTYGIVQPGSFDPNGILLIRGKDYISGWAEEIEFFRVSEVLHNQFKRSLTLNGDILICIVGATTGAVSVVPNWIKEANITQTTARIRCNKNKFSPLFIEYYLKSEFGRSLVNKYIKGSAQPGLNLSDVEKFIIRYPNKLQEQEAIGKRIKAIDNKIHFEETLLQKYQAIKRGLMRDLLGGRKEV